MGWGEWGVVVAHEILGTAQSPKYFSLFGLRAGTLESDLDSGLPIYEEYLNHTLGLTLSTPGLVDCFRQTKSFVWFGANVAIGGC